MSKKPVIMVSVPYYLPGTKAGGSLRSVVGIVENLSHDFEFLIVSSDRDAKDKLPYEGVPIGSWITRGRTSVYYMGKRELALATWLSLLARTEHQLLYLNSLFSLRFTIVPLIAARLIRDYDRAVIVATRGELSPGALNIKSKKKKIFLAIARLIKLYDNVVWHASTQEECEYIKHHFGDEARVRVARNIPKVFEIENVSGNCTRRFDILRIVFLSRVEKKKNLYFCLQVLSKFEHSAVFDIWGPIEDEKYWLECVQLIKLMPANVVVNYCGIAEHHKVGEILSSYDVFMLPTYGENFGHAIVEAFSVGTPVIISTETPWKNLAAKGIGWDIPLEEGREEKFVAALNEISRMTVGDREKQRSVTLEYGRALAQSSEPLNDTRNLFNDHLSSSK